MSGDGGRGDKGYSETDAVTRYLQSQGIQITAYHLGDSQLVLGGRIEVMGAELVYRVEGDRVLIIIYRRLSDQSRGLSNVFAGFAWFIERLAYDIEEVRFVGGKANALQSSDDQGLTTDRLMRFYKVIMGGWATSKPGWIDFELKNYKTMRERFQDRHKI